MKSRGMGSRMVRTKRERKGPETYPALKRPELRVCVCAAAHLDYIESCTSRCVHPRGAPDVNQVRVLHQRAHQEAHIG